MSQITKTMITEFVIDTLNRAGEPPAGKAIAQTGSDYVLALGRERDGRLYVRYEYYLPESHDDDDLSSTGYRLRPRMGCTRRAAEVHGDTVQALSQRFGELVGETASA